jgi:hypothetical protein
MHWRTPKRVSLLPEALGKHRAKINMHFCLASWCASHFHATPSRHTLRRAELGHPSKYIRGFMTQGPVGRSGYRGENYPSISRKSGLAP